MGVFKISCSCGYDIVLSSVPLGKIEVKCPECNKVVTYDPLGKVPVEKLSSKKDKESD